MGNLDFADHAGFSWCCILLMVGGLTMIVLGPLRGKSRSGAILNVILGIVFFCYGLYLTFGFRGGHYYFSYWALILPAVLITRAIRSSNGEKVQRREEAKQTRYAELQDAQEAHAAATERRSK
jgi:membrane-bound ClpP family serine protease